MIVFIFFFYCCCVFLYFFFFQAEDGIRDTSVTGVQTCALPICNDLRCCRSQIPRAVSDFALRLRPVEAFPVQHEGRQAIALRDPAGYTDAVVQIGRASCRERVWIAGGGVALEKKRSG